MTPERWARLEEIFNAAVELDPEAQAQYLREACGADAELQRQAQSLLLSSRTDSHRIDDVIGDVAGRVVASRMAGQQIGPYRVLEVLGRGGMSTVYLAERADRQYQRQVAIKVVSAGVAQHSFVPRLKSERQILANLDHPNISRLLDGGTTEDGTPYLVMEYIDGHPVTEYCDRHRLGIAARLRLFRTVCQAVHYAHQNLIVHRDIKPSNILVTDDGEAKLLDFGIAKILDPSNVAHTIAVTRANVRLMTPEYASPEQIRGGPITTATDTYALGVLLYELLTGHRPYRVTSVRLGELERVICEQYPERPSTVVMRAPADAPDTEPQRDNTPERLGAERSTTPDKLRRLLSGDLDDIVLMAMRKEPERRYGSAGQLAEDVRRYLSGLPVVAQSDTWSYRTGKFVRRHKLGVALTSAAMLFLAGFAVTMSIQAQRIARERDIADRQRLIAEVQQQRTERISSFLVDIFELSDPGESKGDEITAREILEQGADRINRELRDQPAERAMLQHTIGEVYLSLGLPDHALPLLRDALQTRRALFGAEHPLVAECLNGVGRALHKKGEFAAADAMYRQALAMNRKVGGESREPVAETLHNLAQLHHDRGHLEEALPLYRRSMDIYVELFGEADPRVGSIMNDLARLLLWEGNYVDAEELQRRALEIDRAQLGDLHPQLVHDIGNLALLLHMQGELEAAEPLYQEALAMARKVFGDEHTDTIDTIGNVGRFLHQKGDLDAAEQLFRESIAANRRVRGERHHYVAYEMVNLALLLRDQGRLWGAEAVFTEALDIYRETLPADHQYIAAALTGLGLTRCDLDDPAGAEPLLHQALEIWSKELPPDHWQIAVTNSVLGRAWFQRGRYGDAEALLLESFAILEAVRGRDDRRTRSTARWLAELYTASDRPQQAQNYAGIASGG